MPVKHEILAEGIEIFQGDCCDILPTLNAVDAIITDPPYEKEAHRSMRRTHESIKSGINVDLKFGAITEELRKFISDQSTRISTGLWYFVKLKLLQHGGMRLSYQVQNIKGQ